MSDDQVRENDRFVFVLMPFADKYREVYTKIIKPTVERRGYECVRADEIAQPGNINKDIVENIKRADLIIADLTSSNPNVMYELGLSHAIGRVTIMITQKADKLPFDIQTYRVILYEQTIEGGEKLKDELDKYLANINFAKDKANNPVSDYFGNLETAEQYMNPADCLKSLCKSMKKMMSEKKDTEVIKLLRALPAEMSNITRKIRSIEPQIKEYEELISNYIDKPDLDDETIFGIISDKNIFEKTLSIIKNSYFPYTKGKDSIQKEVSAIGFHPDLRKYSLFLIGKMEDWKNEPDEYTEGFFFQLNEQGIPKSGVHFSDIASLKVLKHLWDIIQNEIKYFEQGVQITRFKSYIIDSKNHDKLFRNYLADAMLTTFNNINQEKINYELEIINDQVTLKTKT